MVDNTKDYLLLLTMYKYKIFNNIADDGIDVLKGHNFIIDEINPETIILRSQVLSSDDLNNSLYCIGRAGAGTRRI